MWGCFPTYEKFNTAPAVDIVAPSPALLTPHLVPVMRGAFFNNLELSAKWAGLCTTKAPLRFESYKFNMPADGRPRIKSTRAPRAIPGDKNKMAGYGGALANKAPSLSNFKPIILVGLWVE